MGNNESRLVSLGEFLVQGSLFVERHVCFRVRPHAFFDVLLTVWPLLYARSSSSLAYGSSSSIVNFIGRDQNRRVLRVLFIQADRRHYHLRCSSDCKQTRTA